MNEDTMKTNKITLPFSLMVTGIALAVWTLLRLVLLSEVASKISFQQGLGALGLGLWFDVNTLSFLLVPFLLFSLCTLIVAQRFKNSRWAEALRWGLLAFCIFALLFGTLSEVVFWQEFSTRFNFIAVDYLIYTKEVIGNIRESYPVGTITLVIALLSLILTGLLARFVRLVPLRLGKVTLLLLILGLPLLSYQIANVDQMEFSTNHYANELAGNGLFSFGAAFRRNALDYHKFYPTLPEQEAHHVLKQLGVVRPMTLADKHKLLPPPSLPPLFKRRPKNIVLITVESLSADYLGYFGNDQHLTPYLDALTKQGLVFENLLATGTRTVRGLDALSIAIPPIPGQAVMRRPHHQNLETLGGRLRKKGYASFFIYGGYGAFDNMATYFKNNDYQVLDRTVFKPERIHSENIWGVDDESLFGHAIDTIDQLAPRPFFVQLMTTSNHRPYTFPEGRIDLAQGSREGAVKYTDYAIGQFLAQTRHKPWFKDTLFVIVADHCASVAGSTKLPLEKYHIPMLFYAPELLDAGRYTRLASQIDIVPTLLDVLGIDGAHHFYGQSLFHADPLATRAFVSNYQTLGYYKDHILVALEPKRRAKAYRIDAKTRVSQAEIPVPSYLLREAIAYYQTADYEYQRGFLKAYLEH